jgi:hypothetical protein
MAETHTLSPRRSLTTPRAAAVAGILFALLYGTGMVLIRLSIPADRATEIGAWLESDKGTLSLALNLMPYAGIAFLWFIGVIRDRMGELEDRFFATVLLGSGLLFLAMTFAGAALAGGLLVSYTAGSNAAADYNMFVYGREVMFRVIYVYALRMAGVFMISLGTIWIRTGLMHRGWAFLTYALALLLLIAISRSLLVILVFPGWVFAVSAYFLIRNLQDQTQEEAGTSGAP